MKSTHLILALVVLLLLGGGAYWLSTSGGEVDFENDLPDTIDTMPVEPDGGIGDGAEPLDELLEDQIEEVATYQSETVIGSSVDGTAITAYHFGTGMNEILLVTGMHGADARNTSELGSELVSYLGADETLVPENTRITIIPVANPDGLANNSRFNTNDVDLNRNFSCDWSATSQWREQTVSGGSAPFSEPEAAAIRDYVAEVNLTGAIAWFAAEGKVYPSACEGVPSVESAELAATFAAAAGYGVEAEFDAYTINGDMTNWLADMGVPAISVLLSDRENTELAKNQAGLTAAITFLTQE